MAGWRADGLLLKEVYLPSWGFPAFRHFATIYTSSTMQYLSLQPSPRAACRASAAVEIVDNEIKKRAGVSAGSRTIGTGPSAKRKRTHTPQEACPYCDHTYTVRDGLSTKVGPDGDK